MKNVTVLDNSEATVAGLRFAGIGDPRFTPNKTAQPSGGGDDKLLADVRRAAGHDGAATRNADVAVIHDPAMSGPLFGHVPLILAGHLHHRDVQTGNGTLMLTQGSTGGAGLRGLEGTEPLPLDASILYFDATTHKLIAYDDVTVGGLGLTSVQIQRHAVTSEIKGGTNPVPPSATATPSAAPPPRPPPRRPPLRPGPLGRRRPVRDALAHGLRSEVILAAGHVVPYAEVSPTADAGAGAGHSPHRPHRLVAQDTALSRRQHGFESRWGHGSIPLRRAQHPFSLRERGPVEQHGVLAALSRRRSRVQIPSGPLDDPSRPVSPAVRPGPGSSVGTSARLKSGRSAVRPRPWPPSRAAHKGLHQRKRRWGPSLTSGRSAGGAFRVTRQMLTAAAARSRPG